MKKSQSGDAPPHSKSALVVVFALLALLAPPLRAQPINEERRKALLEGTHVFRRILFDHGCKPVESFAALTADPKTGIVIVLGNLDQMPADLGDFVASGGAVLLASDRPIEDEGASKLLLDLAGVSISPDTLLSPFDETSVYRRLPFCPLLTERDRAAPGLMYASDNQGRAQMLRVATNIPAHLVRQFGRPGLPVLARLHPACLYDRGGGNQQADLRGAPFLVGGDVGAGRVLVAADHSIFINEMMLPDDTNNVEFGYNVIRWLRGDTPRTRVLFIDEEGIQTRFEIPLKSARPSIEELAEMAFAQRNRILQTAQDELVRLERSNAFNEFVSRYLYQIDNPQGRLFATIAVLSTLALMLYGVYRLGIRERFAHDKSTLPLSQAVGKTLPAAPLAEQRTYALMRLGNFNEPAAALARRWFATQGVEMGEEAPAEPPVDTKTRAAKKSLRRLWLLASGRSKERIRPSALWQLQRELESLATARQRGDWRVRQPATRRGGPA